MNDIHEKSVAADGFAIDRRIPIAIVLALLLQGATAVWWAATKDSDDRFNQQRISGVEQMVTQEKEQQAEVTERLARIEERVTAEASVLDRIEKQLGASRR